MNIRNNIARIGATALIGCGLVATSVPATFAVEGAPQVVHTYADSAQFIAPDVWIEGQGLNIGGEGFKTADGTSGSVLALKLNKGAVKIDGQDYLEIHADAAGNFSVTIPWQAELHGSVSVDIYLLSGSLKDGDVPRGGKAATVTIKVAEQPAPSEAPTPAPTEDPTPAPSENPTPTPSEDSTPAPTQDPTTEAPKPADETSAPAVEDAKETKPAEETSAPAEEQKSDQASDSSAKDEKAYKYQNCADVWADRGTSISKDDPDFREKFDANNNGVGCEEQPNYENSKKSDSVSLSSGSNDNLGSGSSNASSKGSSSLAKTGASDAMTAAGLGLIALGAGGATIVATRMRKKA
ncbi:protein containing Glucan-binding domain [Rothia mucilaginosa DY-18]|uniref:Protein containing Glucan-binding domain n=1 Tax=Rothia mucilaginosa (strain DY-18) TaxID=680646 RepID=D2NR38_ROTMD|nr:excalibur calcium-binding domain-containing protein [Rothia mucilaginosa]BAI64114.1 protein containing Glucan-binding domain [Rothia mucilaginosa DY-18]